MFKDFLMVILTEGYIQITHNLIAKKIYCKWKKQRNKKNKCHYWNCKHYKECEYNGTRKQLKESLVISAISILITTPITIITYLILY